MRRLMKYLLLILACIMAASCIFDADQCAMPVDEARSITFTVSLENQRTKAGSINEDGIMPEGLQVAVFAADNEYIGPLQNLYYWPTDEKHTKFQFMGQMPEGFAEHFNTNGGESVYRFMVLANYASTWDGEKDITYSHTQLDPNTKDASIPMWGVKNVDMSPLINQTSQNIGEINLLRAAAKIKVELSEQLKSKGNISISSATLKYYNQTGYCLPKGWDTATDTGVLDNDACIRVYRHAAVNLPFVKDDQSGAFYVYVTEFDNINYPGERNRISLGFKINGEYKYFADAISFCQYSDGKPQEGSDYNIVRNTFYDFEILSVESNTVSLRYVVADWETEDWGSGEDYENHDLMYPTYHNPVMPREFLSAEDMSSYVITKTPEMYHHNGYDGEIGAFECFFQILAPVGVKWKPTINGSKEYYTIRTYTYPDGELLFDTGDQTRQGFMGPCAENKWFRIVVFPLTEEGSGNTTVDFGISYYQEWTDQYINLYVNGDYGHIRWPESGTNPKLISIKHVTEK